jgi:hypothetical protein
MVCVECAREFVQYVDGHANHCSSCHTNLIRSMNGLPPLVELTDEEKEEKKEEDFVKYEKSFHSLGFDRKFNSYGGSRSRRRGKE